MPHLKITDQSLPSHTKNIRERLQYDHMLQHINGSTKSKRFSYFIKTIKLSNKIYQLLFKENGNEQFLLNYLTNGYSTSKG